MLHYGGPSPKRHYALSNAAAVGKLWEGKLKDWAATKKQLAAEGKSVHYVQKYIDKNGKKRWKGNKSLRSSEFLGLFIVEWTYYCFGIWCGWTLVPGRRKSQMFNISGEVLGPKGIQSGLESHMISNCIIWFVQIISTQHKIKRSREIMFTWSIDSFTI